MKQPLPRQVFQTSNCSRRLWLCWILTTFFESPPMLHGYGSTVHTDSTGRQKRSRFPATELPCGGLQLPGASSLHFAFHMTAVLQEMYLKQSKAKRHGYLPWLQTISFYGCMYLNPQQSRTGRVMGSTGFWKCLRSQLIGLKPKS